MLKNRIVLKVGSAVLVKDQKINLTQIHALSQLIAELMGYYEIILVSSGAVASGFTSLNLNKDIVENKQALAAIGQPLLMKIYAESLRQYQITSAQLLISNYEFDSRKRTQNARNVIEVLLKNKILPIINENDVTATGELAFLGFGDNDQLSAKVTHYFNASMLAILSDVEGYYEDNPQINPNAKMRKIVHSIPKEDLETNPTPNDDFATGGIVTKLKAADFLLKNKRSMFLSSGKKLEVLREFLLEQKHTQGTLFIPETA
ncbi:glutamate 5-kinase [Helicobacter mesocricetorum]|uniref:glutamate 5-kinase n=1 Tax=Helicobacter mesocricetorum TaxID=87012 RepID=UPI000CF07AEE|nr:glutamate 5-kinase [Helicobacter mesocricetorum]